MAVDRETVRHIARLARIEVGEAQSQALVGELNGILGWIEQLDEVDTDGVEPMTGVVATKLPLREDVVTDGGTPRRCWPTRRRPRAASSPCRRWSSRG